MKTIHRTMRREPLRERRKEPIQRRSSPDPVRESDLRSLIKPLSKFRRILFYAFFSAIATLLIVYKTTKIYETTKNDDCVTCLALGGKWQADTCINECDTNSDLSCFLPGNLCPEENHVNVKKKNEREKEKENDASLSVSEPLMQLNNPIWFRHMRKAGGTSLKHNMLHIDQCDFTELDGELEWDPSPITLPENSFKIVHFMEPIRRYLSQYLFEVAHKPCWRNSRARCLKEYKALDVSSFSTDANLSTKAQLDSFNNQIGLPRKLFDNYYIKTLVAEDTGECGPITSLTQCHYSLALDRLTQYDCLIVYHEGQMRLSKKCARHQCMVTLSTSKLPKYSCESICAIERSVDKEIKEQKEILTKQILADNPDMINDVTARNKWDLKLFEHVLTITSESNNDNV